MRDKELKFEEVEASHTLGGAGEVEASHTLGGAGEGTQGEGSGEEASGL